MRSPVIPRPVAIIFGIVATFLISVSAVAAPSSFTIMLDGLDPLRQWWDAVYERSLPSGAGWVDGDRIGYRCAWMFLEDDGTLVGRTTFARIPEATYAKVNDRYMVEGVRRFDGSPANGQSAKPRFCDSLVSEDYVAYAGPDERPVVRFVDGGVLETRDYRDTVASNGIKFRLFSVTPQRATVIAYENDLPVIVVYYDGLNGGTVEAVLP